MREWCFHGDFRAAQIRRTGCTDYRRLFRYWRESGTGIRARRCAHGIGVAPSRANRGLAAELTTGSRRSVAVAGDVTRDGDLERAVDLARREFGRLDVAV